MQLLIHNRLVVPSGCKGSDSAVLRTAQAHAVSKQACFTYAFTMVGNTEKNLPHIIWGGGRRGHKKEPACEINGLWCMYKLAILFSWRKMEGK